MTRCLLFLGLLLGSMIACADDGQPYSEGDVVSVAYVRTKYGMFDEYMRYLAGPYKKLLEHEKKDGLILDYGVYSTHAHNPHEPDIVLTVRYRNWAAFDGLREKLNPLMTRNFGSLDAASKGAVDRDKVREILGDQVFQELRLK